jgi:tRNA G46 methylase TrmB
MFILILYVVIALDQVRSYLAPAIPTPKHTLETIRRELKIQDGDEVWELGCGDARVISYCAKHHPKANFIGLENGIIMVIKAKWRTRNDSNVYIRFGNLKSVSPKTATKMYLYLLPETLRLIRTRIPKNCRVVSLEFPIPGKKPNITIKLHKPSKLAHHLYIYKF